jgi:hypothetical protein
MGTECRLSEALGGLIAQRRGAAAVQVSARPIGRRPVREEVAA